MDFRTLIDHSMQVLIFLQHASSTARLGPTTPLIWMACIAGRLDNTQPLANPLSSYDDPETPRLQDPECATKCSGPQIAKFASSRTSSQFIGFATAVYCTRTWQCASTIKECHHASIYLISMKEISFCLLYPYCCQVPTPTTPSSDFHVLQALAAARPLC